MTQHDGSVLRLRKLDPDYDATDRLKAMDYMQQHHARGEVVTGLLYVDPESVGPARAPEHRRHAVESPDRARIVPGLGGARENQRFVALAPERKRPAARATLPACRRRAHAAWRAIARAR